MAIVDTLKDATLTEVNGEVVSARTAAFVAMEEDDSFQDAMSQDGVPQPGDSLNSTTEKNVVVVRRSPKVVGRTEIDGVEYPLVKIDIEYELVREDDGGSEAEPLEEAKTQYALRGGASIRQDTTTKDRDGTTLKLKYANAADGATVQVSEVTVFKVENFFEREIVEATNDPDSIVEDFVNKVNSVTFRGLAAGKWLCTSVTYTLHNAKSSPKEYRFTYRFESSADDNGWTYQALWKEDGKVPSDVADGSSPFGILSVNWHAEKDFTQKFGS